MPTWVLGEFSSGSAVTRAVRHLRALGYTEVDFHSPYPLEDGEEALGLGRSRVPSLALGGGMAGVVLGYWVQWYTNAVDFPINVGNRPPHSPPAFVPVTFELGVLLASLSIFFGLLLLLRLPRPHHPAFEVEGFRTAQVDTFWVSAATPAQEAARASDELRRLGALSVSQVEEPP